MAGARLAQDERDLANDLDETDGNDQLAMQRAVKTAFCFVALFAQLAAGATLYVSTNGSNTSPFDTWDKAATTIKAATDITGNGDTVLVTNGEYFAMDVNLRTNVVLRSVNGAAFTRLLMPTGNISSVTSYHSIGGNGTNEVRGFTIRDHVNNYSVMYVGGAGRKLTVSDCVFSNATKIPPHINNSSMIHAYEEAVLVVSNCQFYSIADSKSAGAVRALSPATALVVNCVFQNITNSAVGPTTASADGLITVRDSMVVNCKGPVAERGNIYNCTVISNLYASAWDTTTAPVYSNAENCIFFKNRYTQLRAATGRMMNCLVVGCGSVVGGGGTLVNVGAIGNESYSYQNPVTVFTNSMAIYMDKQEYFTNSAFCYQGSWSNTLSTGPLIDSDYYDTIANWNPSNVGTNFVLGPRGFWGLRPRGNAVLRNAGTNAPMSTDISQAYPRTNETAVDIGPYEWRAQGYRQVAHDIVARRAR